MNGYFNENNVSKGFKRAGDLEVNNIPFKSNINKGFKKAGDLETGFSSFEKQNSIKEESVVNSDSIKLKQEIEDYLITVVSGKKMGYESELGILSGSGIMFVSLDKLKEMYDSGNYNIVSAKFYNLEMIEVEYEFYSKNNSKKF